MAAFDFVRNLLKKEKLKALNAAALRAQGVDSSNVTDEQKKRIAAQYFVSSGIDHKGQSQCCFEAKGLGGEVEVQVDPAILVSGVFSAQITVGATASITQKTLIIAQVGPSALRSSSFEYNVPFPYLLNSCHGLSWSGGVSGDIFIGVGVTAGISFDMEVAGKDFSAEATAEAKAGLKVNASVSGLHYYAEDYAPVVNEDRTLALENLSVLLQNGGNKKDYFKRKAENILSRSVDRGRMSSFIHQTFGGSGLLSTEEIIRGLNAVTTNPSKTKEQIYEARILINELNHIKNKTKPVIRSSVRITNYSGAGGVEFTANAGANANALGLVDASIEASAKANANGSYKPVTVRSQAVFPAFSPSKPEETRFVTMTQDTRILYEHYDYEVSATASAKILGSGEDSKPLVEGEKSIDFAKCSLNRMSYITTIVYWGCKVPWVGFTLESAAITIVPYVKKLQRDSLQGSGICFGGSYQLKDLAKFSNPRELKLESLQPLYILNTTEDNVGELEKLTKFNEADLEVEPQFDPANVVKTNDFNGKLEEENPYNSEGEEKLNKYTASIFTGTQELSVMPSLIGQALAEYDKQRKSFFSHQSAGSLKAHGILTKMVAERDPNLGDTVAWLIGENNDVSPQITAKFNNQRLHQVGGARGIFTQKSKGATEGRLYGLLKTKYLEAIILDQQAADYFSKEENLFKSNQQLLSKQLQESNKDISKRNQLRRADFEKQERLRVQSLNQQTKNNYIAQENARVAAANKEIQDRFATELEAIKARNDKKRDEFFKKQLDVLNENKRKQFMKEEIDLINSQIEAANAEIKTQNDIYRQTNKQNNLADEFAEQRQKYSREITKKENFAELTKQNEKIIEINREILARNEIEKKKWESENQYLTLLAANLHISVRELQYFFDSKDMIDWMENVNDLLAMGETVLLESTFSQYNDEITTVSTGTKLNRQFLIELDSSTAEKMLDNFIKSPPDRRKLESIRMRWRIQDMVDSSSNLFKLGFSVIGQGAKIQLKNIDEAGSEGIVDLCTVFYGDLRDVPEDSPEYNPGRAARLELAVPPTVLYCL